jgi:hypothetical protein
MKIYRLPRKAKKQLKKKNLGRFIVFQILKSEGCNLRFFLKNGRKTKRELFNEQISELTKYDGVSVGDKKRIVEYADDITLDNTHHREIIILAKEALAFAIRKRVKNI